MIAKQNSVASLLCACGSMQDYNNCCHRLISKNIEYQTLEEVARARYTAFALGIPNYLIDSTHKTHKDYKRHMGNDLDQLKGRKTWAKEILTKNTEVYEFLSLEMLSTQNSSPSDHLTQESLLDSTIMFRVLVRLRSKGTLLAFQETSHYTSNIALPDLASKTFPPRWLYVRGDVTPVPDEMIKAMYAKVRKYATSDTIRDRWG